MRDTKHIRPGPERDAADFPELLHNQPRAELPEALPASGNSSEMAPDPLGEALAIREVAKLIGCSVWTVRHRFIPDGLPHLRTGRTGKLLFYKNQIIRWLLREQQKGGET